MNDRPSLWQLRVFDCVARHENVTRASQELLRTQPAVTACIIELERILGATLFERNKTGIYPSQVGQAAHIRVQRIIATVEAMMDSVPGERRMSALAVAARLTRSQIQVLIAVHECHSFRAAAARLGISDASLQRSARALESHLGCKLYRHTASGIKTTELGDQIARSLKLATAQIEALVDAVGSFVYPRSKRVHIGVMLLDPSRLIVNAIRETHERFPDARIAVINGTYENLVNKLLAEEIDFVIGLLKAEPRHVGLQQELLYRESYCIVARRGHPLALQPQLSLDDLHRYPWILPPAGSPRRRTYEHIFADTPPPPALIETYSLSTIRLSLASSDMLTVLSWLEVLSEREFGLLAPLRYEVRCDEPAAGVTRVEGKPLTELQAFFLDAFRRNAAHLGPA